jgi:D-apionolactonase
MEMPTAGQYLRGTDEAIPERIELMAGPLRMCFEPGIGFLRYIRLGDQEILRGLYSAVRDHNWNTVAADITNLEVKQGEADFEITFDVSHRARDIDFKWRGAISGASDGTVSFEMDGEANSTFRRNRVGFCVLHSPAHVAGMVCEVEKDDGSVEEGRFPEAISPHQPFRDMRAIRHEVAQGVTAEVRFEGDVFEMEDQRNWTDASYKTYCTPLGLPFPVEVEQGTKIRQKVTVSLVGESPDVSDDSEEVVLTVNPASAVPLPSIGLGASDSGQPLTASQARELEAMHLAHLRVDLRLAEAAWETGLERAVAEAAAIGAGLEVAAYVSDAASAELDALAAALKGAGTRVERFMVFHVAEIAADRKWIDLAREKLSSFNATIVSGAHAYFTELNRNRPDFDALDGVCYSVNPQVHAFDDASLMETLIAQGWTVDTTRSFAGNLPIHVSPVTLSPRFNPNATGPDSDGGPETLPSSVDARQMSSLGAAWTVGSLKYLTLSGASSVTYFETTGWKGVLDTETGSDTPFPGVPDGAFPMAQVFTWFGGMAGAEMLNTASTAHRRIDGFALRRDSWLRILLANLTPEKQIARLNCPGLTGTVRIEPLDGETVEQACTEPRRFRSRKDIQNTETQGGSLVLELPPYAVYCVKGKLTS